MTEKENVLFQEALQDKAFMKGVLSMNAEEAKEAFEQRGIHFTLDEINAIADKANELIKSGELNEEALDNVAGGYRWKAGDYVAAAGGVAIVAVSAFGIGMLCW